MITIYKTTLMNENKVSRVEIEHYIARISDILEGFGVKVYVDTWPTTHLIFGTTVKEEWKMISKLPSFSEWAER